jgi:hypothetical protein
MNPSSLQWTTDSGLGVCDFRGSVEPPRCKVEMAKAEGATKTRNGLKLNSRERQGRQEERTDGVATKTRTARQAPEAGDTKRIKQGRYPLGALVEARLRAGSRQERPVAASLQ